MKIDFTGYWDRDGRKFTIINEPLFLERMSEKTSGYFDCECEEEWEFKSSEQLGYLWGEVAVKLLMGLRSRGYGIKDKYGAVAFAQLAEEIDSCEKILDDLTGSVLARIPKRISGMGKKELSQLMSDLILYCECELMVEVDPPEVFKEKRKFRK